MDSGVGARGSGPPRPAAGSRGERVAGSLGRGPLGAGDALALLAMGGGRLARPLRGRRHLRLRRPLRHGGGVCRRALVVALSPPRRPDRRRAHARRLAGSPRCAGGATVRRRARGPSGGCRPARALGGRLARLAHPVGCGNWRTRALSDPKPRRAPRALATAAAFGRPPPQRRRLRALSLSLQVLLHEWPKWAPRMQTLLLPPHPP
jgi:hypothetical protein